MAAGPLFTRRNNRRVGYIAKKLDKIMVNEYWLQGFEDVGASFHSPDFSDHCLGLLQYKNAL